MRLIDADDFIRRVESGEFIYLQADKQDVIDAINTMPTSLIKDFITGMPYYIKHAMYEELKEYFNKNAVKEARNEEST